METGRECRSAIQSRASLMEIVPPSGAVAASKRVADQPRYVVGLARSAGGLEALEQFFDKMPAKTGLAFVVVQHLSPDFRSLMDELLARRTAIPIRRVEDGMAVEADTVYLIPPKKEMIISGGKLLLTDKDPSQTLSTPDRPFLPLPGPGRRGGSDRESCCRVREAMVREGSGDP